MLAKTQLLYFDGDPFLLLPPGTPAQCPACHAPPLSGASALSRHLETKHHIVLSIGKELPHRVELTPTFTENSAKRFPCSHCDKNFSSTKNVKEHWTARHCHDTPPYALGSQYLVGKTPLLHPPSTQPPIAAPPLPSPPPTPTQTQQPSLSTPLPATKTHHLLVYGQRIPKVHQFRYLGRILADDDDDSPAIADRLKQASHTFWSLHRRFLSKKHVSTKTKLAVINSIIMAKVVYGADTWVVKDHDAEKLRAFQQKLLRHALGMHPRMTPEGLRYPPRQTVLAAAHHPDIIDSISSSQLRLLGHMLRRPPEDASHRIWESSLPLPGRVGFVDANLLRNRAIAAMSAQGLQLTDAPDRPKWRAAVQNLRRPQSATPAIPPPSTRPHSLQRVLHTQTPFPQPRPPPPGQ